MESQSQNPEIRNNPENFQPCLLGCWYLSRGKGHDLGDSK